MEVVVLLIDERPEEVTDLLGQCRCDCLFQRSGVGQHVRLSRFIIERRRRRVAGKDFAFMDSSPVLPELITVFMEAAVGR